MENGTFYGLAIAELVVVIIFSLSFKKASPTAVTVMFFGYAFLNGFTLSVIFAAYELTSIGYAFVASAAMFGILAYLGYKTDKDLSNWSTVLSVSLIVGVILSIINLFLGNTMLDIILDWAILFLFFGLESPFVLNLSILSLTFAFSIKINIASIIGMAIAIFIYRKI